MARKLAIVSTGWCVGPSSPTKKESCVKINSDWTKEEESTEKAGNKNDSISRATGQSQRVSGVSARFEFWLSRIEFFWEINIIYRTND